MVDELLTLSEAAARLRLHPETVRRWLNSGQLQGRKLGKTKGGWRIPASEIARVAGVAAAQESE